MSLEVSTNSVPGRGPPDVPCYLAEAIGTGILVLIGPGAAMVAASTHAFGHAGVALAFGLVITLLVASLGTISGAHLNPAVTLAFWSVRRFPSRHVLPYITAQCAGAIQLDTPSAGSANSAGQGALFFLFSAVRAQGSQPFACCQGVVSRPSPFAACRSTSPFGCLSERHQPPRQRKRFPAGRIL